MDYVLPNEELVDGMIAAAARKSSVSIKNLLLRGFYSDPPRPGVCLAPHTIMVPDGQFLDRLVHLPFGFASIRAVSVWSW